MVERLWRIIDYRWEYLEKFGLYPPKTDEIIKAINTLMKLDLAILKAGCRTISCSHCSRCWFR